MCRISNEKAYNTNKQANNKNGTCTFILAQFVWLEII